MQTCWPLRREAGSGRHAGPSLTCTLIRDVTPKDRPRTWFPLYEAHVGIHGCPSSVLTASTAGPNATRSVPTEPDGLCSPPTGSDVSRPFGRVRFPATSTHPCDLRKRRKCRRKSSHPLTRTAALSPSSRCCRPSSLTRLVTRWFCSGGVGAQRSYTSRRCATRRTRTRSRPSSIAYTMR
jgi:hypothetical protein